MKLESEIDNTAILNRIAQGDEAAFRQLFDSYYQKLLHLAIYFLKSRELGEEAVSDVFYLIWKKKESISKINNIESYLYTAVKNQSLHYIRRSALPNFEPIDLYSIHLPPDINDPEVELLNQEFGELIQKAVNSLPEKCREVFRLVLADKLKHKEISLLLNISEKTVEAHIASAYKKIAQYVNKEYSRKDTVNRMLSIFF